VSAPFVSSAARAAVDVVAALQGLDDVVTLAVGAVVLLGDVLARLRALPTESVQCIVTSPPYLDARDYGVAPTAWPEVTYRPRFDLPEVTVPAMVCCLGHEETLVAYVGHLVLVWRELRRVLRRDGTCWLNLGAGYSSGTTSPRKPTTTEGEDVPSSWGPRCHGARVTAGLPAKQRIPAPSAVRDALQAEGWFVRDDIAWAKPNATPSSVRDRCTPSYESLYLLTRAPRYAIHLDRLATPAVSERSRNARRKHGEARGDGGNHRGASVPWTGEVAHPRDVWTIPTGRVRAAHFATFPHELARRCVVAGSDPDDVVLDPFAGTATTLAIAHALDRRAVGVEAQPAYVPLMRDRMTEVAARLRAPQRPPRKPAPRPKAPRRAASAPAPKLDAISPLTPVVTDHGLLFAPPDERRKALTGDSPR
jgi:DNA modification methylase